MKGLPFSGKGPKRRIESAHTKMKSLIDTIKDSADKLASDNSSHGDVKILSRAIRELRYAFKVFTPYRNHRKVTVFGSARTRPDAASYQQAVEFGREMAEDGWLVVTGAASGIMEAGHRGAGREHSMGINIMLPFEQGSNPIIAGDPKLVHMKYFFTRKLLFVKECDAITLFPGGFGTMDEGYEVLTLVQTGKRDMIPIVMVDEPGGHYWKRWHQFTSEVLLEQGMISPEDLSLYKVTDNVAEAVAEVQQFYHNYHSMRYVKQQLVLRLKARPVDAELGLINREFKDILVDGKIQLSEALATEQDEPEIAKLPRLVMHFNRRNLGRLRQLIDYLNQAEMAERISMPPAIAINDASSEVPTHDELASS